MLTYLRTTLAALFLVAATSGAVLAAGSDDSTGSATWDNPNYTAARKAIDKKDFVAAIPLLDKVVAAEPRNADAYNYLGYSYRQLGRNDEAFKYYGKALEIDPDHLGANEYLGELYLKLGQIDKAEERLEVLDDACFFGCDEYYALRDAIKEHKTKVGS